MLKTLSKFAIILISLTISMKWSFTDLTQAQTGPSNAEASSYTGLHKAAYKGDLTKIAELIAAGANLEKRDHANRTPLIVAAYASQDKAIEMMIAAGANPNAFENQQYDIVTIAAVANDLPLLKVSLKGGGSAKNITSPYAGTALIAAAHLGHVEVVKVLIEAGAPLDHVNNLGWTALMEAVVLGDGGPNHVACAKALLAAGADKSITDIQGITPLQHARSRGFTKMIAIF